VLDIGGYTLACAGAPVRLERIPMDLLIFLAQARGQLVTREEIIERLWGKAAYFDTDNGINTAIRKIRRALREDPDNPQYIETVVGKGYRFKGLSTPSNAFELPAEPARIMFAVLPFENLSGDPGQEYFNDGLTEETIARLAQMSPQRLGVIARTSSMAYKSTEKTIAQIGRELGVDYVLEGSVRRDADRVRITAQLIRVKDQIHLWSQSYDTKPSNILDIHSEIGVAIANQVKLRLTPQEQRNLAAGAPRNPEAHDDYLHGLFHHARVTYPELQKAIAYFRRATERDPTYTLAYTGIADSLVRLPITSDVPTREVFPAAKRAILKALGVNPDSAEAHGSDAGFRFWLDWDFVGAKAAARRGIELNANYALAHFYLAHTLSNTGEHAEALAEIRRTLVLDPCSLLTNAMYGQFLYHAGRDAESLEQLKATLELESRFWVAHVCMAKVYQRLGRYTQALECCDKAWRFSGGNTEALSIAGYVHAVTGERAKAEDKIHEMLQQKKQCYVPPYNLALVFAGLNDLDAALHWLEQAFQDRDVHMTFLRDHKWATMRSRPEFCALMRRVGLPE
jgi:TolB-like protein/Flp pilus assembly protein TadD